MQTFSPINNHSCYNMYYESQMWGIHFMKRRDQNLIRPNVVMQCKKGYDSRIDIFMYKCQSIMMVFYFILN